MSKKSRASSHQVFWASVSGAVLSCYSGSVHAQSYRLVDIDNALTAAGSGITNDVNGSVALGLNNLDQVVGYYNNSTAIFNQVPFVYNASNGTATAINQFSSGYMAAANGINNAGVVVGSGQVGGDLPGTPPSEAGSSNVSGFAYNTANGAFTAVAPLGPGNGTEDIVFSTFQGINSAGTAVGYSFTASNANSYRAITYNAASGTGVATNIGNAFSGPVVGANGSNPNARNYNAGNNSIFEPSGNSNEAYSINNKGAIAGWGPNTGGVSSTAAISTVQDLYIATPNASTGAYTTGGFKDINAAVLSASTSFTGSWSNAFIDAAGNVAGTGKSSINSYSYMGFFYNASTGTAVAINAGSGGSTFVNGIADVNGVPVIVGSDIAAGGYYAAFVYENGVATNISGLIPGYTITSANAINSNGDIAATGTPTSGGASHALLLMVENAQSVTYTGAHSNVWDSSTANFSPSNYADGDAVTFDDSATGSTSVTIASAVSPSSVTFNNSSKSYVITGAPIGSSYSIAGGTFFNVIGGGAVTLNSSNTYVGVTNVSSGKLTLGVTGALPVNGQLLIGAAGSVVLASHGTGSKVVLQVSSLSIAGTSGSWTGKLDLTNNDMVVANGSIGTITSQVAGGYAGGTWRGAGITSSAAAADSNHLMAVGVIQNGVNGGAGDQPLYGTGGALGSTFDGVSTVSNDVLVKYTYYGDTDLSGVVDGSDYSRIDYAYESNLANGNSLTGWYNGDFNYDGVIDGSDYTLMDNAFNSQGAAISAQIANSTALIAGTSAVPEPETLGLLGVAVLGALRRRPRVKRGIDRRGERGIERVPCVMSDTSLFRSITL
jgi:hypothetical protein